MHTKDVGDAADAKAFAEKRKFCLRILAQLNTLVHGANDVCLGQEVVRDALSRSDSDSEGDASSGNCGDSWPRSARRESSAQAVLHPGRSCSR